MKVRESGMPEESFWESFFDIQFILSKLQFDETIKDAIEFGSGYGTFTIPAAKIIKGSLLALDIDAEMINLLRKKILNENLSNIKAHLADFVKEGTKLNNDSVDYAMLFNILHAEDPVKLLSEANRVLVKGGKVGVIHWVYSPSTPRGPSLDIRPKPEQCIGWLKQVGFELGSEVISLPPYHYGFIGIEK